MLVSINHFLNSVPGEKYDIISSAQMTC